MPPLPPLQKTGPDKGSLAWWNHLGWALVEIPQVSTKPKISSYNDAVGRGKIRVAEDLFLLRGVFVCCGMGLPSHFFFRNCLWEKLGQMFLLQKKKLGPSCDGNHLQNFGAGEGKQWWDLQVHPWPSSHVVERVVGGLWSWCQMGFEGGWNVAHKNKNGKIMEASEKVMYIYI